jgi:hypothetical protein
VFERDLRASIEVVRKLKIITDGASRSQAITKYYESQSETRRENLVKVQERLTQPDLTEAEKKVFVEYNQHLEKINEVIRKEKGNQLQFAAGIETLLKRKEANLQLMIDGLRQRQLQDQNETPTGTIDISELQNWGIESLSDLAFRVDFVALEFRIKSNTVRPSTKTGDKLKMKSTSKDDETPL